MTDGRLGALIRPLARQGMLAVLLLLCGAFSVLTYREQQPSGEAPAAELAAEIRARFGPSARVLVAASADADDAAFADRVQANLVAHGITPLAVVKGEPRAARQALHRLVAERATLDAIACNRQNASWLVFADLKTEFLVLGDVAVLTPRGFWWPTFLMPGNLRNVANQIAVIAILAIGMTLVIITGGIDLSVGSLVGMAAVVAALVIRDAAGALDATPLGMALACLAGIGVCGLLGLLSGGLVTAFGLPPFLVTLAMMQIARGLAYLLSRSQSIYQIPESFIRLGRGADLFNIPNAVVLMLVFYGLAHLLMTRTVLGRYLYAVGGNREAARLAGVPVRRVLLFAYACSGLLAGIGGVLLASSHKSAEPSYGMMYELHVIAAVVVGGASLSGGEGQMFGTLVGAFIIAVIQNGMNLLNVDPDTQKVVSGAIILAAVLLDRVKHRTRK